MSFVFAPKGWALCNGQLLPINQNQALVSLLGTTYGGNGQTTFALPDLRGRTPMHEGSGHTLGERGGESAHTLSIAELPGHTHTPAAIGDQASAPAPSNVRMLAASRGAPLYRAPDSNLTTMESGNAPVPPAVANAGGSQPHVNQQPFLTLNFCIALQGIFPSQT